LDQAKRYLKAYNIQVNYVHDRGPFAPVILQTAEAQGCDLIIMGGYGDSPWVNFLLESVVDQVLRLARKPMLLCR
jgi:nucleotide-binding universal stress UspA family protein